MIRFMTEYVCVIEEYGCFVIIKYSETRRQQYTAVRGIFAQSVLKSRTLPKSYIACIFSDISMLKCPSRF